jgi:hypothetical protein
VTSSEYARRQTGIQQAGGELGVDVAALARWMDLQGLGSGPIADVEPISGGTAALVSTVRLPALNLGRQCVTDLLAGKQGEMVVGDRTKR